jgi:hypothetical protein
MVRELVCSSCGESWGFDNILRERPRGFARKDVVIVCRPCYEESASGSAIDELTSDGASPRREGAQDRGSRIQSLRSRA